MKTGGKSGKSQTKAGRNKKQPDGGQQRKTTAPPKTAGKHHCKRCGRNSAREAYCPAKQATCSKCNRQGHFARHCFSKTIETHRRHREGLLISGEYPGLYHTVAVGGKELILKVDTGAEVTVITEETYRILEQPRLQQPSKALYGPITEYDVC